MDNMPTLQIADAGSSVVHELEDVRDLYEFCIVELTPKRSVLNSTGGYLLINKRSRLLIAMVGLPARGKVLALGGGEVC